MLTDGNAVATGALQEDRSTTARKFENNRAIGGSPLDASNVEKASLPSGQS